MGDEKLLGSNPKARHDYFIDEMVEAGLVLKGTEIKSLRTHPPSLRDSYVEVKTQQGKTEAWLLNAHIAPYEYGNVWNHEPLRPRKLLLHRDQIQKILVSIVQKGISVIPLRMYLKDGYAKVELGLGKGKKKHDKREDIKKRSAQREMDQAIKKGKRT